MRTSILVFSRTHSVDYRFLATPEGFSADDIEACEPFIGMALDAPDTLAHSLRWCAFHVSHYLVFGCSGLVTAYGVDAAYARDRFERPIRAFVGAVFANSVPRVFPDAPPLMEFRTVLAEELAREWRAVVPAPFRKVRYGDLEVRGSAIAEESSAAPLMGTRVWPDVESENWKVIRMAAADSARSELVGVAPTSPDVADAEFAPFTDVVVVGNATAAIARAPSAMGPEDTRSRSETMATPRDAVAPRRASEEPPLSAVAIIGIVGGCVLIGAAVGKALIGSVGAAVIGGLGGLAGIAVVAHSGSSRSLRAQTSARSRTRQAHRADATPGTEYEAGTSTTWKTSHDNSRPKAWK